MTELPINEIFETIQGEATWAGTPSIFVRLQGCDVGCPWCDTKYTWKLERQHQISFQAMTLKGLGDGLADDSYAMIEGSYLGLFLSGYGRARHIVITGGEPCDYDLRELTRTLHTEGRTTQIETSGTREIRASSSTWVTVSPKINMPGGYEVLESALDRANEIKMPVGRPKDVEKLKDLLDGFENKLVWLQPLSQSAKATKLCVEAATENGWRISCQVHKFINVR